jgi:hypothetical protein
MSSISSRLLLKIPHFKQELSYSYLPALLEIFDEGTN